MSSTKRIIADQVLYRLYGGKPYSAAPVQRPDIYKSLEQKINSTFKLIQFGQNLPSGETIPDNLMIATYENITVSRTYNDRSKSTLPVMPISLPKMIGIYEIRPIINVVSSGEKELGQPFIPLQSGQNFLLQADKLLNDLMGQIGYEPNGKTVTYTKDITTLGITSVDMKLVVFDMSVYGETDVLPLPADMEDKIVNELVAQFSTVIPENALVNPYSTQTNVNEPQNKK